MQQRNRPRGRFPRGGSLPLEEKVVRLKPDRMRSKVAVSHRLMAIIDSFDLISRN